MKIDEFFAPVKTVFGVKSSERIGQEARKITQGSSVLLMADPRILKTDLGTDIQKKLGNEGFSTEIYDKLEPEPTLELADEVSRAMKNGKYDLVVGLGGGSTMDMAKVASIMALNPGKVGDYVGNFLVKKRGLPLILLPTTAGTGSEVSWCSVVVVNKLKRFINSPHLLPDTAIVDPLFTMSMPPRVTSSTGLDALAHAIEGMLSIYSSPITDALALQSVKLIGSSLRRAWANGNDLEARYNMSNAALLAGLVMNADVISAHSIGNTISIRYDLPHGLSCSLPLPYMMKYDLPVCSEKLALIATALDVEPRNPSLEEKAMGAVKAVKKLLEDLNLPSTLKDLGVQKNELEEMAEECVNKYPKSSDPRKLTKEDAKTLYLQMWEGRIE
jgi:alcohol dehydrogenase class IV